MNRGLQAIETAGFLNMGVFQNTHCSELNKIKDLAVRHISPPPGGTHLCATPHWGRANSIK